MTFYGLMMETLALLAVVLTPVALGVAAALLVPSFRVWLRARGPSPSALVWGALAVATTATAGSLYLSEVVGFPPCTLCWVQRGAMYPLVLIYGGALATRRLTVVHRSFLLPLAGLVVAVYHAVIQLQPALDVVSCEADAPCSARWVAVFGFVSIPWLAGAAFILILVLVAMAWVASGEAEARPAANP